MPIILGKTAISRHLPVLLTSRSSWTRKSLVRLYSKNDTLIEKKAVSIETMAQAYDPKTTEAGWYDWWESKGYFKPQDDGKVFTVILPPPNVTGTLHLGHALTITVQDVYIRWKRMRGENVLWIPGFDHAGLATQAVVEKNLQALLNITKFDLGREEFLKKVSEWKSEKEEKIIKQVRQLGASVDWGKKYFTMDDANSEAVKRAFIKLNDKGLIYRYNGLVSWCSFLGSSVSDIEISWQEITSPCKINVPGYQKSVDFGYMYQFAYKICKEDNSDEEIIVSTTRPETMLGDTAIAVHPDDARYTHLKNCFAWHPFRECKIPIIFDKDVDMSLGEGAVKITPAHSPVDFRIGERHNLEVLNVIDEEGLIKKIDIYSGFQGMKRFHAREKILNKLKNLGLFRRKISHSMTIPTCSRSGDVIEYVTKPQWYLKCSGMYEKVLTALLNGDVIMKPESSIDVLKDWFRYGRDWNLSRQIWWGHQIPMYECIVENNRLWVAAMSETEARTIASEKLASDPGKIEVKQDSDVLDTWFSSGLLPLTLAGWPYKKREHYPLGLMETGSDILFFWVARMLMLGLELTGEVPFKKVVLHGLVCDAQGRKMSKSLGNVVLPEHVISGITLAEMEAESEKNYRMGVLCKNELRKNMDWQRKMFPSGIPVCGVDALRFSLCSDKITGDSLKFDVTRCRAYTFFGNKMWQALKYLLRLVDDKCELTAKLPTEGLSIFDRWILSSLAHNVVLVNDEIEDFYYHIAVDSLYVFFIKHFCSVYLESTKSVNATGSKEDVRRVVAILFNCLETSFRLLSPFMPFVTEELYHCLPKLKDFTPSESITVTKFPEANDWVQYQCLETDKLLSNYLEILSVVRTLKDFYRLSGQHLRVTVSCPDGMENLFGDELTTFLKGQTKIQDFQPAKEEISQENVIIQNAGNCTLYLYHEHNKKTLEEMFASTLGLEKNLSTSLEILYSTISQPKYQEETPLDIQGKNSLTITNITRKLNKIQEIKSVIEKAR